MSEYHRVVTAEDLSNLDEAEVVSGYRDGFAGDPEPGNNRPRSYWHGWVNGRHDRFGLSDAEQSALIKDLKRNGHIFHGGAS